MTDVRAPALVLPEQTVILCSDATEARAIGDSCCAAT
jgi:hypothetical protein